MKNIKNIKNIKNKILFGLILFLSLNNNLFAQQEKQVQEEKQKPSLGLSVYPGGLLIQKITLGETYDLYEKSGVALQIENKDGNPHTYVIGALKPSQVGNTKWLQGYSEISDPGWFWVESAEVTVEAQSKKQVRMFLKIPDEKKYYNQHWTVSLGISGKPEAGQMLSLAVYPRYQIETESKTGLKERPEGLTGIEPGSMVFENVPLGQKEKKKIKIYNNDTRLHYYTIASKIIEVDPTREQIGVSAGYSWIPDIKWLKPGSNLKNILTSFSLSKSTLRILPNENKELAIAVKIPEKKEHYQKKWEALIFIEPDDGRPSFVRVQIDTEKIPGEG